MKNAVKRIGVLTSGGDAPGMNACIRAVVRSANARGIECVGIRRGYQGLISGDIVEMDNASVSRIINRGGTMLYTARSEEFRTEEGQQKAVNTCKLLGLDGIVPRRTGLMTVDALLAGNSDVFWNAINHLILPAALLGFHSLAYISRMTRSFMLAQLSQEFIITARVKGLTERQVIWNHAFRNILVQLLTVVALAYGSLLEGAVLIETVFSWPGFGSYLTGSLLLGDMNAVMGCVLLVGVIFVMLNLLSDMLYQFFDPRTKS